MERFLPAQEYYRENAGIEFPIYLEQELQIRLGRLAQKSGTDLGDFVNGYLKAHIASIEAENG